MTWGVRFCANTLIAAFLACMMGYIFHDTQLWILGLILMFYGVAILYEVISDSDAPAMGVVKPGEVQHLEQIERHSSSGRGEGVEDTQPTRWDSPRDVGRTRGLHAAR